ncbi:MAG: WecB/TagA/CpsF family glycosyltransferase, partial [Sphingomonadales bacterium]|nr:WecB/TagA/CpsF family glycosyltransferase [Sphingomonadales bacterium]
AGAKHYFYGGQPGVADAMAKRLTERYPGLAVAGCSSPPFRPASLEPDPAAVDAILGSGANIVWVGLSTPKQEYWMAAHVSLLPGVTLIGVGAAFDFHTGAVKRAPRWMRDYGLEWAHRLISEPRRLWRRYLVLAPKFLFRVGQEAISRK